MTNLDQEYTKRVTHGGDMGSLPRHPKNLSQRSKEQRPRTSFNYEEGGPRSFRAY